MERGVKRVDPRHRNTKDSELSGTTQERAVFETPSGEVTNDELREFLEADDLDVQADPFFKESLRRKLWDLVRNQYGAGATSRSADEPGLLRPPRGFRRDRSDE